VGYICGSSGFAAATSLGSQALFNCQQLADFCLDFLDGSLPEEERRMFQDHLGECGECVTFFRTYQRTPQVSREAFALQMPSSVKETVRSFLRARYEQK
jgi:anti-sigma factor RsiW